MNSILAEVTFDAFLAARYCVGDSLPEGRAWERAVSALLQRPGLERHQQSGLTTLFGARSLSGTSHEVDAAAAGWSGNLVVECKAKSGGVSKSDVATFQVKVFDFYSNQLPSVAQDQWWPIIVSAGPVSESVRIFCARWGVVLCEPERFPLPVLLRAAAHPAGEEALPAVKLAELLRVGERTCQPMQAKWRIVEGEIRFRPEHWSQEDMSDLLWLQGELSGDLFDAYDRFAPGRLEQRIAELTTKIAVRERAFA